MESVGGRGLEGRSAGAFHPAWMTGRFRSGQKDELQFGGVEWKAPGGLLSWDAQDTWVWSSGGRCGLETQISESPCGDSS